MENRLFEYNAKFASRFCFSEAREESKTQNKLAAEQKAGRWEESTFRAARLEKNAASTAERGEALERKKSGGFGRWVEIMRLFQCLISEAFGVNGFSLVANETCMQNMESTAISLVGQNHCTS